MRLAGLAPVLLLALAAAGGAPAPGPLRIIGAGTGCIAGARALPPEGPGYTVIRAGQSSFWGAPNTLRGISMLATEAQADGLPELYIGDISGPRGGPLAGGHIAHQRGLDVDIYLDTDPKPRLAPWQMENLTPPALVEPGSAVVDPSRWSSANHAYSAGNRIAGARPAPGQCRDQASALRNRDGRPELATSRPTLVGSSSAYAPAFRLPAGPAALRQSGAGAARGWV
jgi:penicillin-insensitive murein endopeptidase